MNYLQIMGYAMGSVCAPAHVNIFVPQFEKQHIYSYIKNKLILYLYNIYNISIIYL